MNKLRKKRTVDRLIEAYVSWREACLRVTDAYDSWASQTGASATGAFAWYMETLDREESAAETYANLVRRTEQLVASERPAGVPSAAHH
jgi:hypothetical protein